MKGSGNIVALGYGGLDSLCLIPELPVGEKVEATQTLVQGGGPAATAAFATARLGARTSFIGVVGDDSQGKEILRELAGAGIDTSGVKVRLGAKSPTAYCWIESTSGARTIAWSRGTGRALEPKEINPSAIRDARLLHLDGHNEAAAIYAAEIARESGTVVSIDAGTYRPGIERLIGLTDIAIASENFARKFTGGDDFKAAVRALFKLGPQFAGITMGTRGSIGFDGKKFYEQPAFEIEVVDTTGAGDVFHGAFAFRYSNGGSYQDCLRFASAVAALKCTKLGGRTGIPTLAEVEDFLRRH